MGPEILDLWIESELGQAEIHYWQDEPDQLAAVLATVGPWFEGKGAPAHREADYLEALVLWQLTDRRHRVDDEVLENAEKVLTAKQQFPRRRRLSRTTCGARRRMGAIQRRFLFTLVRRPRRRRRYSYSHTEHRRAYGVCRFAGSKPVLPQPGRASSG